MVQHRPNPTKHHHTLLLGQFHRHEADGPPGYRLADTPSRGLDVQNLAQPELHYLFFKNDQMLNSEWLTLSLSGNASGMILAHRFWTALGHEEGQHVLTGIH